jgi:hypothetical protein
MDEDDHDQERLLVILERDFHSLDLSELSMSIFFLPLHKSNDFRGRKRKD